MAENSRHFLKRKAIERILNELYEETRFADGEAYQPIAFKDLTSNARLLQLLSAAHGRSERDFDPLAVVGDPDDLDYYRHRAAGLLSYPGWEERNLGVKLIGLTRYWDKIPTLLKMLSDRTPVSLIRRIFGGDFEQVGFIRRNIVQALRVLDHFDIQVESCLFSALEDNYFEVRAQACRTAAHFGRFLEGNRIWLDALLARLADPCFEVVMEAARALGEIGIDVGIAGALLEMKESHYWQVRNAALNGLERLIERGVVEPSPELFSAMSSFILTSTDFKPHFTIKETFTALQEVCRKKTESDRTSFSARSPQEQTARKSQ